MQRVLVILALIGVVVEAANVTSFFKEQFEVFKLEYHKVYADVKEEQQRLQVYIQNRQLIARHNERFAVGKESFKMGVNAFTDLLPKEFESLMLSSLNTSELETDIDSNFGVNINLTIAKSVDWRTRGAVSAVRSQGSCGACWAFSATGALEGHHFIKSRQLVALSVQNLVDCTRGAPFYNSGCNGGWPSSALTYIKINGGINSEKSYPYEGKDRKCRYNRNAAAAKVAGVVGIPSGSESDLAKAVAAKGPVSVAIDASSMQNYRSGVFKRTCNGRVNHAVLVVGYGTDPNGGDYWIVKNSWGRSWGENGYIRMARNRGNQCKIASYAVYPAV